MADSLKIVSQAMNKALAATADEIGDALALEIAGRAPRRTGTLAESIASEVDVTPNGIRITVGPRADAQYVDPLGRVHRPAKYAHLVERREPFLRPVFDEQARPVVDQISRAARKAIESLDGK